MKGEFTLRQHTILGGRTVIDILDDGVMIATIHVLDRRKVRILTKYVVDANMARSGSINVMDIEIGEKLCLT